MSESRQVRRARERAEAKAAQRPPQPRAEHTFEVELNRYVEDPADYVSDPDELEDEPDERVSWRAEWWLKGSPQTIAYGESDLQAVVDNLTENLTSWGEQSWGGQYVFQLEWTLRGDPPEDGTIEDAIAEIGVVLPTRLPTNGRQLTEHR